MNKYIYPENVWLADCLPPEISRELEFCGLYDMIEWCSENRMRLLPYMHRIKQHVLRLDDNTALWRYSLFFKENRDAAIRMRILEKANPVYLYLYCAHVEDDIEFRAALLQEGCAYERLLYYEGVCKDEAILAKIGELK